MNHELMFDDQMDKASIIKDAIDYIQELHNQERMIQAEISELESKRSIFLDFDEEISCNSKPKRSRFEQTCDSAGSRSSPIEVLEVGLLASLSLFLLSFVLINGVHKIPNNCKTIPSFRFIHFSF